LLDYYNTYAFVDRFEGYVVGFRNRSGTFVGVFVGKVLGERLRVAVGKLLGVRKRITVGKLLGVRVGVTVGK